MVKLRSGNQMAERPDFIRTRSHSLYEILQLIKFLRKYFQYQNKSFNFLNENLKYNFTVQRVIPLSQTIKHTIPPLHRNNENEKGIFL